MGSVDTDILGGFRLLKELGSGGEAKVYKAVCVRNMHKIVPKGKVVALKIVYEHGADADGHWQKLQTRVKELMRLDNPYVVRYLGCFRERGQDGEKHVVVQEFLEGRTLKEQLALSRLGLDVDEGRRVVNQVLEGLDYTTGQGIYHRDIKPANVFLCADGGVKLIDFGVAKQVAANVTVTVSDNIRGTWNYMAPEFTSPSFSGDVRSDVFSVGVLLHEILVGTLPYADLNSLGMSGYYSRWSQQAAPDVPAIRVDPMAERLLIGVENILSVALARNPAARYASFRDFRRAFDRVEPVCTKGGGHTYQRLKFVGRGGFGEVFKARCQETGELVAIKKLLKPEYASRFRREAKIMRRLDDPCFVKFIDFFELRDGAFLVMRFLEGMPGGSLHDAIIRAGEKCRNDDNKDCGLPKALVLAAFERYARGLAVLHGRGIVHRDIKPSNLYYPEGHPDCVAIMDFGIVRAKDTTFTYGNVPCTPDYAPPEIVISGDRGEPAMDIFSLGLCMYEALTGGRKSYPTLASGTAGYNALCQRAKTMQEPNFDDCRVRADSELLELLQRMTAPDKSVRMNDANEVARELRRLFYRPSTAPDCPTTAVFGSSPDISTPIDAAKLLDWFKAWREKHPVEKPTPLPEPWPHPGPRKTAWKSVIVVALVVASLGVATWRVARLRYGKDDFVHPETRQDTGSLTETNPVQKVVAEVPTVKPVPDDYIKLKHQAFKNDFDIRMRDEPVTNRRDRIASAERLLRKAIVEDHLCTEGEAARFRAEIEAARKRVVGVLKNGSGLELVVDGRKLPAGVEHTFSFDDGEPIKRTMRLFGHDERPLPSNLDEKVMVVTTNDFNVSTVKVELPESLEGGVTCFFNGKQVGGAGLSLTPGSYECVYRREGYEEQRIAFDVLLGTGRSIPEPDHWKAKPVDVELPAFGKDVVCSVDGKPSSEVKRLMPGEHAVEYRRKGYFNQTIPFVARLSEPVSVPLPDREWRVRPVPVAVPELERGVWCAIDGTNVASKSSVELMPGKHALEYERYGYVRQGTNFVVKVGEEKVEVRGPCPWEIAKVRVSVPKLERGVECRIDGKSVAEEIDLVPGGYSYEYVRTGFKTQADRFVVMANHPMNLPEPGEWVMVPSPKAVPSSPDVLSPSYKEALERYAFQDYGGALEKFHAALKEDCRPRADDMDKIEDAFKKRLEEINGLINRTKADISIGRDPKRSLDDLDNDRKTLIKWYNELKAAR